MEQVFFWLFLAYDALVEAPHFWVKVVLGLATGLLIPRKLVGLLICALGNAALFVYSSKHGALLPQSLIALLVSSIIAFVGVVWWVVGRILRWGILRVARIPGVRRRVRWIVRTPGAIRFFTAWTMAFVGLLLLALAWHYLPLPDISLPNITLRDISLPDISLAQIRSLLWRILWIMLALVGIVLAIIGFHVLSEDRFALLLDDWRFRRSLR